MASRLPKLIFLSGRSNVDLAESIASYDGFKLSKTHFRDFANKEMYCKIEESVRGEDVFILQTCGPTDPNKDIMELLILAHTARRASARRITAVIPYIYGSRQDRKSEPRTPVTIQLIGDLLRAAGVDRVATVSIHNHASVAAFNSIIVDNISTINVFIGDLKELHKEKNFVVFSPDAGGVPRAKSYANILAAELGFAYKSRAEANKIKSLTLVGDVRDKNILIVDDIVDTGGTHIKFAQEAVKAGAKEVYYAISHAVLSNDAANKIQECPEITKIFVTDSIHHSNLPDKFIVKSLGGLLGETIVRVNSDQSFEGLYDSEECK